MRMVICSAYNNGIFSAWYLLIQKGWHKSTQAQSNIAPPPLPVTHAYLLRILLISGSLVLVHFTLVHLFYIDYIIIKLCCPLTFILEHFTIFAKTEGNTICCNRVTYKYTKTLANNIKHQKYKVRVPHNIITCCRYIS